MGLLKKHKGKEALSSQKDTLLSRNLVTMLDPKAPASEAYRTLRTNINYAGIDRDIKTLAVTSAGPAEGKSTTCANLAVSMAQTGKKVLLLEADLRKPKVHKQFGLLNDNGITNILLNDVPYISAVKIVSQIEHLHFLCAGWLPPNPSEVLESRKMQELIERLSSDYDIIIVDTPPVGQLTDAAVVGKMCDGVLLVLASGETNNDLARHAKTNLEHVGANILGAVITKIDKKSGDAYYRRYNSYYRYYYEND